MLPAEAARRLRWEHGDRSPKDLRLLGRQVGHEAECIEHPFALLELAGSVTGVMRRSSIRGQCLVTWFLSSRTHRRATAQR